MKIILSSIGTRGDMEPFLAIGEILQENGHQVICLFPEQFRQLAEDSNFEFASLGTKFIEMLDSEDGKIAMGGGGSGIKKMMAFIRLAFKQSEISKEFVKKQHEVIHRENPDRIVHNGKAIYPVIWSLENKGKTTLVSPVPYLHYVKDHAHVFFNKNYGAFLNKLTYTLANYGLVKTIMRSIKWFDQTKHIQQRQIQEALFSNNAIYTISPSLFQRPNYWNANIRVLGYHERNKTMNWEATAALQSFIAKHPKLLFITFGSMMNPQPKEKTELFLKILQRHKIPAIINTAAGGLVELPDYDPELIHFVSRIPYDWVFPKIYAVIHHGGSGTTHTALKYACATLIIPHIIDQFVWNKIIYQKGAGPKGIKIGKITVKNLEPKILDLLQNSSYKENAMRISQEMEKENFREAICQAITNS